MDRDGDSPKQDSQRCDRCQKEFTNLRDLREHEKRCGQTGSPEERMSPGKIRIGFAKSPSKPLMGSPNLMPPSRFKDLLYHRCYLCNRYFKNLKEHQMGPCSPESPCKGNGSPEKSISPGKGVCPGGHLSRDLGTSKSPCKAVKTPPPIISSIPMGSPNQKVHFSPDLERSMSPCEKFKSPPPVVSPKIKITYPKPAAQKFPSDQGTSRSPAKTFQTSPEVVSGNTTNSPRSSTPDRDSPTSPCTKALQSAKRNWQLAHQSWLEAGEKASRLADLLNEAVEKKQGAIRKYMEAFKREQSLTVIPEDEESDYSSRTIVTRDRERTFAELQTATEEENRAFQAVEEATRYVTFCGEAAQAAGRQHFALRMAETAYNTDRDEHSRGSPNRKLLFSPDQRTSPSKCRVIKTPPPVVSSRAMNSPGSSSQVNLTRAFAATLEEEKAIAESAKSFKAEGDYKIGSNLELKALEESLPEIGRDMKQSESTPTSKSDLPEKTPDCVTEKGEELEQSNLKEATNVLHAQDDKIDSTSDSVTHHGRWTQRQQLSPDDPDEPQAADAVASSSHVAERIKQSDESPETKN